MNGISTKSRNCNTVAKLRKLFVLELQLSRGMGHDHVELLQRLAGVVTRTQQGRQSLKELWNHLGVVTKRADDEAANGLSRRARVISQKRVPVSWALMTTTTFLSAGISTSAVFNVAVIM
ncbi:hypothetical protein DFH08DRAFT_950883 [Mycena albidolilacea]|uniref:Uncharacterized protein n=1 Tax=Mycena albidolilacea TaxID=1033008 RepID=A0AAD7AMQ1_9AGAR|nr:hypothetical protein DFH08DRAFT_950883 [Mycena albidolilacea]